jgi:hypothetical protein
MKGIDFCDVVFTYKKIAMFKFLKNLVQMDPNQKCNSRSRKLLLRHLDDVILWFQLLLCGRVV